MKTFLQQTTKFIITIRGMQTPFVYHYVEQISGNYPFFIKVQNFLTLFLLRLLALHLSRPLGKNLKVLLSSTTYVKGVQI